MSLKGWMMAHLPEWLMPLNPWGAKGRPHNPDLHAVGNKQQVLNLRIDRLEQRAALERWRREHRFD